MDVNLLGTLLIVSIVLLALVLLLLLFVFTRTGQQRAQQLEQKLLQQHAQQQLSQLAQEEGYLNLRQAGLRKVVAGISSLEEVMSATL